MICRLAELSFREKMFPTWPALTHRLWRASRGMWWSLDVRLGQAPLFAWLWRSRCSGHPTGQFPMAHRRTGRRDCFGEKRMLACEDEVIEEAQNGALCMCSACGRSAPLSSYWSVPQAVTSAFHCGVMSAKLANNCPCNNTLCPRRRKTEAQG